ncbi:MAG: hypothetical protein IKX62_02895 [Bacteroidales bacterium]|nr:hypothetical protein [Bacteroidales bacterium]
MKTESIISKALIALALMFAVQAPAGAQLGNLLNKAKNAVEEKTKEAVEKGENAVKQSTLKSAQEVLGEAPALPWVMDEKAPAQQLDALLSALSGMASDKTQAFGEQISARAEYDAKLLAGMQDKTIREDEALKAAATKELELADKLFGALVKKGTAYGLTNMQQRTNGDWYHQGPIKLSLPGEDQTYYVTVQNDDAVFCTKDSVDGIIVGDAGIAAARKAFMDNLNIAWLLEGYAKGKDKAYDKEYHRASLSADILGKAINNNNKEVVDRVNKYRADLKKQAANMNTNTNNSSTQSSSGTNNAKGRPAKSIRGSNSNVTAYVGSTQVGTAKLNGSSISVYTKGSTGATGVIHSSTIDFRGASNRYRIDKVGETLNFRAANNAPLGSVEHNKTMRKYQVKRNGSTATIAEFDDSLDPRFAALFFYNFFD